MPRRIVLSVENLTIVDTAGTAIVDDVTLQVREGEVLALIGGSGSGKTTLSLACTGYLQPGLRVKSGRILLADKELLSAHMRSGRAVRGSQIAYVAQSAAASFNPRIRLINQVVETALLRRTQPRSNILRRATNLFEYLSLPQPTTIGSRFPYQVSGGQLQRFMIAMGLQEEPLVLVCDEPTSALDVTTQIDVIELLKKAITDRRMSSLFVSHDLAVVAQLADRIAVMRKGKIVEVGEPEKILYAPDEEYTNTLLTARRKLSLAGHVEHTAGVAHPSDERLGLQNITCGFGRGADGQPLVVTLKDVSLQVRAGEIVAVIGESGSGKSTLARAIIGLHPPATGTISIGERTLCPRNSGRSLPDRRDLQLVTQSADTALNPKHSVRRILKRTLKFFRGLSGAAAESRAIELLQQVQLPPAYLDRLPGELSGGEKQRVNLARALAAEPKILICDEIISALDTIVADSILELLRTIRSNLGVSIIFITHDIGSMAALADRVVVMRRGRIVENDSVGRVLATPVAAYTKLLVASAPELQPGWLEATASERRRLADIVQATEAA